MADIFKALAYPWHMPEAQQLHRLLTETFFTVKDALDIAQTAGLPRHKLLTEQPVYFFWKDVLEMASSMGLLRKLVETARNALHEQHPSRIFFNDLLAGHTPVLTASLPPGSDGAPQFIESNDLFKPEALLFLDDLTLQTGRLPFLLKTLHLLQQLTPSVCHLLIDFNGVQKHGTGFRIDSSLLLTNWHVLHDKDGSPANAVTAEFGYEDDGSGGMRNSTKVACVPGSIVTDKDDDWAVISTQQPLDAAWPVIKLSESAAPQLKEPAYIIQHPMGQSKRLGFVRNQVADFTQRTVHYFTDTQEGSSGSPVLNANGRLIALHHAGGRPQQIPGMQPVKKNEGIRIERIIQGLTDKGIAVP